MSFFCSGGLFFEKNKKKFIDFNYFPFQIRCKFENKYPTLFTLNISNRAVDNESAEGIDSAKNSSENQSAGNHETEEVCTGNDYFDCKNYGSTFCISRDQENMNPNGEFSGTCRSCTAAKKIKILFWRITMMNQRCPHELLLPIEDRSSCRHPVGHLTIRML